ncbi:MAG: AAA family ATPase [bacterium]|nr:AAA family ATPase [bacterium]
MKRFFNTAGPIIEEMHYFIPPLSRVDLEEKLFLIDQAKYFILHAPRQTGKTSLLRSLMTYLNKEGKYTCLHVNIESAQAAREDVRAGMISILGTIAEDAWEFLQDPFLKKNWRSILEKSDEHNALKDALRAWCKNSKRPIILLLDEIDSLVGDTLISVLRQLRSGYEKRPKHFPQSIILCGVRDVKDYRLHSTKTKEVVTGGSAFNVKAESLKLGNFTPDEINELYQQHTRETGQPFHDDVFPLVWELTEGQPWLVNALAYETCFKVKEDRGGTHTITAEKIQQAKENLILRRETHLDQLADKLREERVRRVIEPMLSGSSEAEKIPPDDLDYVADLGLINKDRQIRIANRIYMEVIPRQLTYSAQLTINQEAKWYTEPDGCLNMDKLLTAFQQFFRTNSEHWSGGYQYAEAGPQLLLQAFLQRIVNGGGRIEREYGFGRTRTDLLVIWPHQKGKQEIVIELKIRRGKLETIIKKGLEQTHGYMDKCGTKKGYLLVFDRDPDKSWEEKIFKKDRPFKNSHITVYGM